MQYVLCVKRDPGCSHPDDLTLRGVKLLIPLAFPSLQSVQVPLQNLTAILVFNCQVYGGVVHDIYVAQHRIQWSVQIEPLGLVPIQTLIPLI